MNKQTNIKRKEIERKKGKNREDERILIEKKEKIDEGKNGKKERKN